MGALVPLEMSPASKALPARGAGVRALPRVGPLVDEELRPLQEALGADGAGVGPLPAVHAPVLAEV